jgi:hypothetical protein
MTYLWYPENSNFLLLEVPSVFLVDEYEVEVVANAKLLVDFSERWCKVEAAEEETNRNSFSYTNPSIIQNM